MLKLSMALLFGVGLMSAFCMGYEDTIQTRLKSHSVPVTFAPISTVKCFNSKGGLIFTHESSERKHALMRINCEWWLGCCVNDPPGSGQDARPWGVGYVGDDSLIRIDGKEVECYIVDGYMP